MQYYTKNYKKVTVSGFTEMKFVFISKISIMSYFDVT